MEVVIAASSRPYGLGDEQNLHADASQLASEAGAFRELYDDRLTPCRPPYYNGVPLLNVMALELYNHTCENAH